jgi:hypothetical protein
MKSEPYCRSVNEVELVEVDLADPLSTAEGIIVALLLVLPVWAAVIVAWWLLG